MGIVALLLVVGLLALGLPRVTRRDRKRFWHPWLNLGLLPLLLGLAVGPSLRQEGGEELLIAVQALLALALAAAGVLVGTQLRFANLVRAGSLFLRRHTTTILLLASAGMLVLVLACLAWALGTDLPLPARMVALALAWCLPLAALLVTTSQTPPLGAEAFEVQQREVVTGHVAPAGWWNIVALVLAGLGCSAIGVGALPAGRLPGSGTRMGDACLDLGAWQPLAAVALPALAGIILAWLATRARRREEGYAYLLAVIACTAGVALALGLAPLLAGILVGAVFANASLGRAALVERSVEELEQPTVVSAGLIAGLAVADLQAAATWLPWLLVALLLPLRLLLRGLASPTSAALAGRLERRLAGPGAAGVLVVASLALLPDGLAGLILPAAVGLAIWTAIAEVWELRAASRL